DDAPPVEERKVKRHKASKSLKSARGSFSKHSTKDSNTYVSKQQKQQHQWDAWVEEIVIDEDEVIPEDEAPELITELQNVDKCVPLSLIMKECCGCRKGLQQEVLRLSRQCT
nr:hypothetical protein [Tanacetum cinerariifolium]